MEAVDKAKWDAEMKKEQDAVLRPLARVSLERVPPRRQWSRFFEPMSSIMQRLTDMERDFFKDIPGFEKMEAVEVGQKKELKAEKKKTKEVEQAPLLKKKEVVSKESEARAEKEAFEPLEVEKEPDIEADRGVAGSTYSFNLSSTFDEATGNVVTSIRRRYEDSMGHQKAICDRRIGGLRHVSTWKKDKEDVKGKHQVSCAQGSIDAFEKQWNETPFGKHEIPEPRLTGSL